MEHYEVAVIDSGIGGLSVLDELKKTLPDKSFIYFGDNGNAPYGNKSERELLSLAFDAVSAVISYRPACVVLGCNTLSVTVRKRLEDIFEIPIVGTYPPIERETLRAKKTALLCTCATAKRIKTSSDKLSVFGMRNLAAAIEDGGTNSLSVEAGREIADKKLYTFDTLVLGCTHYALIKNEIVDHFCPQKVKSGGANTALFVKKILRKRKSSVVYCKNKIAFIGKFAQKNEEIYYKVVKEQKKSAKNFKKS